MLKISYKNQRDAAPMLRQKKENSNQLNKIINKEKISNQKKITHKM